jgi:hypothetical protein
MRISARSISAMPGARLEERSVKSVSSRTDDGGFQGPDTPLPGLPPHRVLLLEVHPCPLDAHPRPLRVAGGGVQDAEMPQGLRCRS